MTLSKQCYSQHHQSQDQVSDKLVICARGFEVREDDLCSIFLRSNCPVTRMGGSWVDHGWIMGGSWVDHGWTRGGPGVDQGWIMGSGHIAHRIGVATSHTKTLWPSTNHKF